MNDLLHDLRQKNSSLVNGVHRNLEKSDVRAIAISFIDNSGIARAKAIPFQRLDTVLSKGLLISPVLDTHMVNDVPAPNAYSKEHEILLFPDIESLSLVEGDPGWAWVAGSRFNFDGSAYELCHRNIAGRLQGELSKIGLVARISFEVEWSVEPITSKASKEGKDTPNVLEGSSFGLARLVDVGAYCLEILEDLEAAGVGVNEIFPGFASGQFKVSTDSYDIVRAGDVASLVRHVIRIASRHHDLRASFSPTVSIDGPYNCGQVRFVFQSSGKNLFGAGSEFAGLTPEGEAIFRELISELNALVAIGAPSYGSYLRFAKEQRSKSKRVAGLINPSSSISLVPANEISGEVGAFGRIGVFDQSASPYLVGASMAAVATAAIEKLRSIGSDTSGTLVDLGEFEDSPSFPTSVDQAVEALKGSQVLMDAFGQVFIETFASLRVAESNYLQGIGDLDATAAVRYRY
ncbi:hypothetical protein [Acidithrix sp. C25]|uniref:hypothetical protein n=1 Tax=Acidithrix sp. C25 TaxID=1671482 RepID=UPI00191BBB7D|nr:hypothetical protein [Acidithrix sp. C25]